MFELTDQARSILSRYVRHLPIYLTTAIGFDGATASQQRQVFTPSVDSDVLLFAANVDFSNALVTVRVTDTGTGYVWNPTTPTPITAIAGIQTQVMPLLALVEPYLLTRQSKLQMDFTNSASSLTTNGNITWAGLKLLMT